MTRRYGITENYEANEESRASGENIFYMTMWSGRFMEVQEAYVESDKEGTGYHVYPPYDEVGFFVKAPVPRTEANYQMVDALLNVGLNAYDEGMKNAREQMQENAA